MDMIYILFYLWFINNTVYLLYLLFSLQTNVYKMPMSCNKLSSRITFYKIAEKTVVV